MRIALAVLLACAVPAAAQSGPDCPEGQEMDDEGRCVRDDGQITGGGTSLGGAGLSSGPGETRRPSDSIYQRSTTGGGGAGAARTCAGGKAFPEELLGIKFARFSSIRAMKRDNNGHAPMPVARLPAGYKVGFRALSGRNGRRGGGSVGIGWSPSMGLEHPVDCGWTIWIATDDDPRPGCFCWMGPHRANADVPLSVAFYTTPLGSDAASEERLRARSCVLEGDSDYFLYFAATGGPTSKRCGTRLVSNGTIGVPPADLGAPQTRTR